MPSIIVRGTLRIWLIAIAAAVPSNVARRAESTAISKVSLSASIMVSFANIEEYHFVVNPPHFERDFELLKDRTISTRIGAYKNRITSPR